MIRKIIASFAIFGAIGLHQLIAWNPISSLRSAVNSVGSGLQSAGEKIEGAGQKAGEGFSYVGKEIEKNVVDPIVGGWEQKRKSGRALVAGANQLRATPDMLEKDAVEGLQTGLVQGINKGLMLTLVAKTNDIAANREEIAQNKKVIEDNKEMASELGKASLVKDLLDGFDSADQALAMLWAGQALVPKESAPTSAIGALRQNLANTIQTSGNEDFSAIINANKNDSIIWDLLNAGQAAINNAQAGIAQIKEEIGELNNKIYPSGQSSLPDRMKDLGTILEV